MLKNVKYFPPQAEKVRIQMEGLMADNSCWPTIKAGTPEYLEFENYTNQSGQDVILF
jgi:hypothetical protein